MGTYLPKKRGRPAPACKARRASLDCRSLLPVPAERALYGGSISTKHGPTGKFLSCPTPCPCRIPQGRVQCVCEDHPLAGGPLRAAGPSIAASLLGCRPTRGGSPGLGAASRPSSPASPRASSVPAAASSRSSSLKPSAAPACSYSSSALRFPRKSAVQWCSGKSTESSPNGSESCEARSIIPINIRAHKEKNTGANTDVVVPIP
mmetsp:Transcript_81039/g.229457  ORF Transcript_81039/g.229457 Transcript_81039/m.229457 type:complete len:205 (+) Transcript_81039:118-732(+)